MNNFHLMVDYNEKKQTLIVSSQNHPYKKYGNVATPGDVGVACKDYTIEISDGE